MENEQPKYKNPFWIHERWYSVIMTLVLTRDVYSITRQVYISVSFSAVPKRTKKYDLRRDNLVLSCNDQTVHMSKKLQFLGKSWMSKPSGKPRPGVRTMFPPFTVLHLT
jgi:hypothetical protein